MTFVASIKSEQYPATDETQCVTVYLPAGDEFKALLAGLINIATEPQNYDDPDSAQTDGLCAVWDTAYDLINWLGCGLPPECEHMDSSASCTGYDMITSAGNALVIGSWTNHNRGNSWAQSPPANNDNRFFYRTLATGTYAFTISCVKTTGSGKLNVTLTDADGNASNAGDYDLRAGSTTINSYATGFLVVAVGGVATINLKCVGTTGAGYRLEITEMTMWLN